MSCGQGSQGSGDPISPIQLRHAGTSFYPTLRENPATIGTLKRSVPPINYRLSILFLAALIFLPVVSALPNSAEAACTNTERFSTWLKRFKQHARNQGVSNRTIRAALGGMTLSKKVLSRDRRQGFFAQTFASFSRKLATEHRRKAGIRKIKKLRSYFERARKKYGVPPEVITGFWALESDFGVGMGKFPVMKALATLAYDCRRKELFEGELLAALKIIDRGDLRVSDMIGSWAGELGQTQFLPTHYLNHAVDFDGDGHANLFKSEADIIGTTAAFIQHLGWRRGEPWLQEVRVPAKLPWQEADLSIQHPRSKWTAWGVRNADGSALKRDSMPASLLLPMGRKGPAFLAYNNFKVYVEWNNSLTYATTAAYLATRIAGAPTMRGRNRDIPGLSASGVRELQRILSRRGFDVGKADGIIGAKTRKAVRTMQLKYGLPADSYPTAALLRKLR